MAKNENPRLSSPAGPPGASGTRSIESWRARGNKEHSDRQSESELTAWKRQTMDITEPGRGRVFPEQIAKSRLMKLHQDEEEKQSQIRMKCNEQTRWQMSSDQLD